MKLNLRKIYLILDLFENELILSEEQQELKEELEEERDNIE